MAERTKDAARPPGRFTRPERHNGGERMSDARFREALGEAHPVVRAVEVWTYMGAHPLGGFHPDAAVIGLGPMAEWELAEAEAVAQGRAGLQALRRGLDVLAAHGKEPPPGLDAAALDALEAAVAERRTRQPWEGRVAAAARELRAYGFTFEMGEDGRPVPGKGRAEPMPRERKENGGRTLWTVTVEALARAFGWDEYTSIDWPKRAELAEYIPGVFRDRADPRPAGPLARTLGNIQARWKKPG